MLIRGLSLGSLTPAETDLGYRIRPKKRLKLLWAQNNYTAIAVKNIAGRKTWSGSGPSEHGCFFCETFAAVDALNCHEGTDC